ncbi:hypothetical protein V7183_12120 [Bacillus sp. JJ1127]|uniref:hypothetical protein n=1 Tax=Bacillus sp. JJ1127 TaxID=3122952 RepID=UPI002FFFA804
MEELEIEQLKAQAEQYKASHEELVEMRKREVLRNKGFTGQDTENAMSHLNGETTEEIEVSLKELMIRLRIEERQQGADPGLGNGFRHRPSPVDPTDIGRKMYERIKGSNTVRSLREIKEEGVR